MESKIPKTSKNHLLGISIIDGDLIKSGEQEESTPEEEENNI